MKASLCLTTGFVAAIGLSLAACNRSSDDAAQDHSRPETITQPETAIVPSGATEGTVVSYGDGTLVLADREGKESRIKVGKAVDVSVGDGEVRVNIGGRRLRGEDLKKGLRVRVNTNKEGDVVSITSADEGK